jgi:hypothetical protein
MLYILLPSPMLRSLQLLFRPRAGEYSDPLTGTPGFNPASVLLFANYLNFGRTPSVTLFGNSAPTPLESAFTKIAPITHLESAVSKTKDLKGDYVFDTDACYSREIVAGECLVGILRTRRPCYHARRMKVEKRRFDQALKKMLRAKPEPVSST